jgi:WD40 repeat protein
VFATASTDTSIQLWDVRKLGAGGKPLAAAGHSKGVQSALFAPDGEASWRGRAG